MAKGAGVSIGEALADKSMLTPHDGRPVVRVTVQITKAGDGLSKALGVAPRELHHGQEITFIGRGVVGPIKYDPILDKGEDTGLLARQHTIETRTITIADDNLAKLVSDALDAQALAIKKAEDEAKGQTTIDDAIAEGEKDETPKTKNRGRGRRGAAAEPPEEPDASE